MQITRQADYAVRAVLYLTKIGPDKRAATSQIARSSRSRLHSWQRLFPSFPSLDCCRHRAAHVEASHWRVSPEQISLLEVVEAIDGPILLNECVAGNGACTFGDDCPMQPIWCDAQSELVQRLRSTTFDTFLKN